MPGAFEGETVTRRRFMTMTVHGAGAVAVSAFALPALGFAAGSAIFDRPPVRWEAVGAPSEFPNDNYVPRVITAVSGIGEVGKTTVYMRAHNPQIDGPIDKTMPGGGQFIAISTRCMHLGCPVRWVEAAERFICPCHGGVYNLRGIPTGGPPVRPLDRFYTRINRATGLVEVGPRYSVNSELHRFSPRLPGEPLDGVGQYLYPSQFAGPQKP
jgi:quinol---cytochrome c reductase iron-sulfur subunit, bacillus type